MRKIKSDTIERRRGLASASLLKPVFSCELIKGRNNRVFGFRLFASTYVGLTFFAITRIISVRTIVAFCLGHLYHLLSILRFYEAFRFLASYSNYKAYFILPMSTHKNTLFVATKGGLKNLSSRFLGLMRRNIEIRGQTNFNFRLFIHKNFNVSDYINLAHLNGGGEGVKGE